MDDDVVEHTLVMIPECFAFRLPPRRNATGWLAADMTESMWSGRLRIVQRGKDATIQLTNKTDGKIFAMSRVKEGSVDKVKDSSRYFVLKVESPDGRHAFIGLAFNDRNASFDFNVALQEFQKDVAREAAMEKGGGDLTLKGPAMDFTLKEGEKIKMNIGGAAGRRRAGNTGGGGGGGGGGFLLAPPPGDTPSTRSKPAMAGSLLEEPAAPAAPAPAAHNSPSGGGGSPFGGGGSGGGGSPFGGGGSSGGGGDLLGAFGGGVTQQLSPPRAAAAPAPSPFGDSSLLGGFGSGGGGAGAFGGSAAAFPGAMAQQAMPGFGAPPMQQQQQQPQQYGMDPFGGMGGGGAPAFHAAPQQQQQQQRPQQQQAPSDPFAEYTF